MIYRTGAGADVRIADVLQRNAMLHTNPAYVTLRVRHWARKAFDTRVDVCQAWAAWQEGYDILGCHAGDFAIQLCLVFAQALKVLRQFF